MTQQKFNHGRAKVTAYLDGPLWQGDPTATLGQFSCDDVAEGVAVLELAIDYLRQQGHDRVIGPMDGDTWHSYRFAMRGDDSPAFMMEPPKAPECIAALAQKGFEKISGYFSARVPLAQAAKTAPPATDAFTIEPWDRADPETLFRQVYALSAQAFAGNAFYKPITEDAFLQMYLPLVPVLKPEFIFFARRPDGSLAGFLFGLPNYAEGPTSKTAILKTYASLEKGAGQHLAYAFHRAALKAGFKTAIHALIHDDNLSALRSAAEGAEIFRRYALFGRRLDG